MKESVKLFFKQLFCKHSWDNMGTHMIHGGMNKATEYHCSKCKKEIHVPH